MSRKPRGPWGWENATAMRLGKPATGALELPCYTDRYDIAVDRTEGPYRIISTIDDSDFWDRAYGPARLGLIIRVEQHLPPPPDHFIDFTWDQDERDVSHGGDGGPELAALVSPLLGIRLPPARMSRSFDFSSKDRLGYPHHTGIA